MRQAGGRRRCRRSAWVEALMCILMAAATITARAPGPDSVRSTGLASRSSGRAGSLATPSLGRTDPDDAVAEVRRVSRLVRRTAEGRSAAAGADWRRTNSGDSGSGNRPSRYLIVISHTERALRYTAFEGARHSVRVRNGSRGSSDKSQRNVQVSSRSVMAILLTNVQGRAGGLQSVVRAPAARGCRGRRATV